jgi:hypothetical protein
MFIFSAYFSYEKITFPNFISFASFILFVGAVVARLCEVVVPSLSISHPDTRQATNTLTRLKQTKLTLNQQANQTNRATKANAVILGYFGLIISLKCHLEK